MASQSSSAASVAPLLGCPMSEKITCSNHMMWRAQVLSALRSAQLAGHISSATEAPSAFLAATGDEKGKDTKPTPNPEYI